MDTHDFLFSPVNMLNEQIARQVFEIIPDQGPIMLLIDPDGNRWPSDSEKFAEMKIDELFLHDLCVKIDDGVEPIISQRDDCCMVGAQLATERTNCGYVVFILPQSTPEKALANGDLLEILIAQINLIAKLIEKNNLLYELQIRQQSLCCSGTAILN